MFIVNSSVEKTKIISGYLDRKVNEVYTNIISGYLFKMEGSGSLFVSRGNRVWTRNLLAINRWKNIFLELANHIGRWIIKCYKISS